METVNQQWLIENCRQMYPDYINIHDIRFDINNRDPKVHVFYSMSSPDIQREQPIRWSRAKQHMSFHIKTVLGNYEYKVHFHEESENQALHNRIT